MKANVGMQYPVFAPVDTYTPGTGITYEAGIVVAEAVSASINWERADGHFYGDDVELDSENGVLGYTISFEPTGLKNAARAAMLGESVTSDGSYRVTDASAPDGGFGYIRVMREDGTNGVGVTYEGWWYYKLKFGIDSEETRTKEHNLEWRVPTLTGTGSGVLLGATEEKTFSEHKDFETMAAAKTWLRTKANIT